MSASSQNPGYNWLRTLIAGRRKIPAIRGYDEIVWFAAYYALTGFAEIPLSPGNDLHGPPRQRRPHLEGIRVVKDTSDCDLLNHRKYSVRCRIVHEGVAVVEGQEITRLKE